MGVIINENSYFHEIIYSFENWERDLPIAKRSNSNRR